MSQKYVIQWVSKVNGRTGKGTKVFNRHDADALVKELNEEYPDIHHEPIPSEGGGQEDKSRTKTDQVVSVE